MGKWKIACCGVNGCVSSSKSKLYLTNPMYSPPSTKTLEFRVHSLSFEDTKTFPSILNSFLSVTSSISVAEPNDCQLNKKRHKRNWNTWIGSSIFATGNDSPLKSEECRSLVPRPFSTEELSIYCSVFFERRNNVYDATLIHLYSVLDHTMIILCLFIALYVTSHL